MLAQRGGGGRGTFAPLGQGCSAGTCISVQCTQGTKARTELMVCPSLFTWCINFVHKSCDHEDILAFGDMRSMPKLKNLTVNLSNNALVDFDIQGLVVPLTSPKLRTANATLFANCLGNCGAKP